jgi:hypothetical protein
MRKLPRGEFDMELAAAILGVVMVCGVVVLRLLPDRYHPGQQCTFHVVTGLPCLTCGGTRAAKSLGQLKFTEALAMNPLVALWLICALPHFIWVTAARAWNLPRPRVRAESRRDRWIIGIGLLLLAGANWAYLIAAGV